MLHFYFEKSEKEPGKAEKEPKKPKNKIKSVKIIYLTSNQPKTVKLQAKMSTI